MLTLGPVLNWEQEVLTSRLKQGQGEKERGRERKIERRKDCEREERECHDISI
jgi:hypothetical protein